MKRKILIVDDEDNMLHMLSATLNRAGYEVLTATDGKLGLFNAIREGVQLILCDLKMPQMDGLAFLEAVGKENLNTLVIMMSAFATIDTAVEAMKLGAYDFITKPFKRDEIICVLEKAVKYIELQEDNQVLRTQLQRLQKGAGFSAVVGKSSALTELINLAGKVAKHETTVLITGESGGGKELIARGIYANSPRANKAFVPVNCGSIPSSLMESEFFGHVRGAFSGADKDRRGLFEEADGGTIFLDEIGELPLDLQVKLLRVLQEREIRPVGSNVTKKVNVRVIAATAKDLMVEVKEGRFREDLFYRLNVVTLKCPALRERKDDIVFLCTHFIKKYSGSNEGGRLPQMSRAALDKLMAYHWPGNVRELENCIERALIFSNTENIEPDDLQLIHDTENISKKNGSGIFQGVTSIKEGKSLMERHLITKALMLTEGNKSQAAQLLEISYPSLLAKIKDFGLE